MRLALTYYVNTSTLVVLLQIAQPAKIYAGQSCVKAKTTRQQVFAPKLVAVKECLVQEVI